METQYGFSGNNWTAIGHSAENVDESARKNEGKTPRGHY